MSELKCFKCEEILSSIYPQRHNSLEEKLFLNGISWYCPNCFTLYGEVIENNGDTALLKLKDNDSKEALKSEIKKDSTSSYTNNLCKVNIYAK